MAQIDWDLIVERIRDGLCTPFLGAGASVGFEEGPGLLTGNELARQMAIQCGYPGADKEDLFASPSIGQ